jgi:predicted AAA+ superfamily ATPase
MALTAKGYRERCADAAVTRALSMFGAALIEGPKWCGKTWTALNQANSAISLADPAGNFAAREIARTDPGAVLHGESPRLIDEWQEAPGVWDAVRFAVDQSGVPGRFLLAGSSAPLPGAVVHSGAGRIARVRMRTMSLLELGASSGSVSLAALLAGERPGAEVVDVALADVTRWLAAGGWPATLHHSRPDGVGLAAEYLHAIEAVDMLAIQERYDPVTLRLLLRSLARHSGTLASKQAILTDINGYSADAIATRSTLQRYLELLERIFVLERVPSWHPALRSRLRMRRASKTMLADPSLTLAALGASEESLLKNADLLGAVFEELCLHDLSVYCDVIGAHLFHYHDDSGLEVDAIIEAPDGQWGAFEVKVGAQRADEGAAALKRLQAKIGKLGGTPPRFLAVLTGVGPNLVRPDKVATINISTLRP